MRLWHKELIPVLPREQLLGQWRECCLIYRNISVYGEPNHALVNRIMDYPIEHFWNYTDLVFEETRNRNYECNFENFWKWTKPFRSFLLIDHIPISEIFYDWHDERYYWQCYYNLEEKYDCGKISKRDWDIICDQVCLKL